MPEARAALIVEVKDEASANLNKIGAAGNQGAAGVANMGKAAASTKSPLESLTKTLGVNISIAALAGTAVAAGAAMLKMAMDAEQTKVAFTTLTGSAQNAEAHLKELRDFAATTPFEFTDLTEASKKMMAFGFEAEKIVPMLTSIGDAVSAMGGGSAQIERVTLALGQMQAKGKVTGGEMMQLTEAGIPGWRYLAEAMGKSTAEVMKMSEKGLIPAGDAINYILAGMSKDFGGMMAAQSATAAGQVSNLNDKVTALGTSIGALMLPVQKLAVSGLGGAVDGFTNLIKVTGAVNLMIQDSIGVIDSEQAALRMAALASGDLTAVYAEQIGPLGEMTDAHDKAAATTQALTTGELALQAQTEALNSVWQSYGPTVSAGAEITGEMVIRLEELTGKASDLTFGLGEVTKATIFNTAAAGLNAEEAYEMAKGMGLVTEKADSTKSVLDELRKQYENGEISAKQYRDGVIGLGNAVDRLPTDKRVNITVETLLYEVRVAAQNANLAGVRESGGQGGQSGQATGGQVFPGQSYVVGDGGRPEMFVPDTAGYIYPSVPSANNSSNTGEMAAMYYQLQSAIDNLPRAIRDAIQTAW